MIVSGTVARIVGRHVYLKDQAGGFYLPFGTPITVGGKAGRKAKLAEVGLGDSAELEVARGAPTRTVSNTKTHGDSASVTVKKANFVKNGLKG